MLDGTSLFYKIYDELFPRYIFYGMTEEQYWDGDPCLVTAYRKAHDLRMQYDSRRMYFQNAYLYDTLMRVSPIFGLSGGKIEEIRNETIPFSNSEIEKYRRKEEEKKSRGKAFGFLKSWMDKVNAERRVKDGRR